MNNSKELNEDYMLDEALLHLIQTLPDTLIMLVENDLGELIAFIQYQYGKQPDSGEMLLTIETAILASDYRKSRVFYEGFRSILQHILEENPEVKQVQFYALADHRYLNRLYSKFAKRSGVRQSSQRNIEENRYIQDIGQLMKYLRI
ncbi:hypothetical protein [Paenibacillus senegalensis]|uniref:hypothetical protein n=1 Tax=Paenibacillus senegalensis TaxID=1465766 RepID=UPI0002DA4AAB|nr:hypothetical protein [Paenibacillus senegalensis]